MTRRVLDCNVDLARKRRFSVVRLATEDFTDLIAGPIAGSALGTWEAATGAAYACVPVPTVMVMASASAAVRPGIFNFILGSQISCAPLSTAVDCVVGAGWKWQCIFSRKSRLLETPREYSRGNFAIFEAVKHPQCQSQSLEPVHK